jgi:hypothetical protein
MNYDDSRNPTFSEVGYFIKIDEVFREYSSIRNSPIEIKEGEIKELGKTNKSIYKVFTNKKQDIRESILKKLI